MWEKYFRMHLKFCVPESGIEIIAAGLRNNRDYKLDFFHENK